MVVRDRKPQWDCASDAALIEAIRADASAGGGLPTAKAVSHTRSRGRKLVQAGGAVTELQRRHWSAVVGHAAGYCRDIQAADGLTREAFENAIDRVRSGCRPSVTWRPYVLASVFNTAVVWISQSRGTGLTPEFRTRVQDLSLDSRVTAENEGAEDALVAASFWALPERCQLLLWHTVIDDDSPEQVGILMGTSPALVPSMAQRAREILRETCLRTHLDRMDNERCRPYIGLLAAAVRRNGARPSSALYRHVSECQPCATALLQLDDLDQSLQALPPALLFRHTEIFVAPWETPAARAIGTPLPAHAAPEQPLHTAHPVSQKFGIARVRSSVTHAGCTRNGFRSAAVIAGAPLAALGGIVGIFVLLPESGDTGSDRRAEQAISDASEQPTGDTDNTPVQSHPTEESSRPDRRAVVQPSPSAQKKRSWPIPQPKGQPTKSSGGAENGGADASGTPSSSCDPSDETCGTAHLDQGTTVTSPSNADSSLFGGSDTGYDANSGIFGGTGTSTNTNTSSSAGGIFGGPGG
ncbi:RNA polymerase sigma factor [Streptomyces sp. M41]|uniref:RNA polymerase sigma factor n=1 Tax=Streptomyces sp. M41 TaxID=3059412 RepID=UPI00374D868C